MKKITQFSVKYPVTVLMMVLAVLLLGYISFTRLGVDLFPDMSNPRLYVELQTGERPPEEIENLFVERIEAQAIRQSDVVKVSSITRVGASQITVEYSWNKDMDEAFLDLQKALTQFAQNKDIDELNITQFDPNSSPVMIVALDNDSINDLNEIRKVAENYIRNEIIRLEGIADVTLAGQDIGEVVIETDPYKLEAFNLTANDISSKINNYNRNVSGGNIEEKGTRYSVKGVSMIDSPDDLHSVIVGYYKEETNTNSEEGEEVPVYLSDVATIKTANKDPESVVRLNGDRCIGLSIYKEPRYNTSKAVDELNEAFESITKALPGYSFTIVKDQGQFITAAITEVQDSALLGIVFAVIILFIFLRRINTTLVISIAIPISIIATFTLMYFRGLTLNIMTLGGLALGAGMLVDNAIIVMENIYRNMQKGKSVVQSAIEGTAEVGGAIVASTITTIVVFLPIVYLHGASGQLFKDQAWTVAFSLISSLVVAILVIPVLVTKLFPKNKLVQKDKAIGFRWYQPVLSKIIKYRWPVIAASFLLVGATYMLIPKIGSEFMPKSASNNFTVELKLPEGTRLERTSSTVAVIEQLIKEQLSEQIEKVFVQIGASSDETTGGSSLFVDENDASMFIHLSEKGMLQYDEVIRVLNSILSTNDEMEFAFVQDAASLQSLIGDDEPPLVVEVVGEDLEEISSITETVKEITLTQAGLYNVESSIENGAPEIDVKIDRVRAGLYNLSIDQIITQLQNRLEGTDAGEFEQEGEMIDITIKQPEVSVQNLVDMEIKNGNRIYRLSDVAEITEATLPREIHRRNQSRIGKISAYIDKSKPFDHVIKELESKYSELTLPNNYRIQITGEEQKRKESMGSLTFALILSIILVYMVMASQFESLVHPFTILLTIPLALVGAVLTFYLLGRPFNIMAFIGMIMLVGIAVNDSIILVDAINQNRRSGMKKMESILLAGMQRIRPIIMTTLTTILALVPLTFGFGESAELRSPMAWAVIGGLVTSTLLTLVVIPCFYFILSKKDAKNLKPVEA